ncbi:MAG: ABC transporter ATP-binding protein [Thermoleophilia bacterium]|nr:ABC transporter ATP-binding protein [Thermoleophilia bacterium]
MLAARGLALGFEGVPVVRDLDLVVPGARTTVIVGANACGKSTLLRGLARILRPQGGCVTLDGRDIRRLPTREVARIVGLLPQQPIAPEDITVADLVARGRHPHRGWARRWSDEDERIVAGALAATGTLDLAGRRVDTLSGGQRQRAWIAMALAQDPGILLLDEPTSFLDVAHQIDVLDLLCELNHERGTTVVMVLHDLNLAARYADHLIVMAAGRIVAAGPPAQVISAEIVHEAYGLASQIIEDPVCGSPMVVPVGRFHARRPASGGGLALPGPAAGDGGQDE